MSFGMTDNSNSNGCSFTGAEFEHYHWGMTLVDVSGEYCLYG